MSSRCRKLGCGRTSIHNSVLPRAGKTHLSYLLCWSLCGRCQHENDPFECLHHQLQNCAYAILRRSLVYMLESRLVIPYLQHGQAALQGSGKLIGCKQMKNFSINSSFFVAAGSSLRWIAGWRTKLWSSSASRTTLFGTMPIT